MAQPVFRNHNLRVLERIKARQEIKTMNKYCNNLRKLNNFIVDRGIIVKLRMLLDSFCPKNHDHSHMSHRYKYVFSSILN